MALVNPSAVVLRSAASSLRHCTPPCIVVRSLKRRWAGAKSKNPREMRSSSRQSRPSSRRPAMRAGTPRRSKQRGYTDLPGMPVFDPNEVQLVFSSATVSTICGNGRDVSIDGVPGIGSVCTPRGICRYTPEAPSAIATDDFHILVTDDSGVRVASRSVLRTLKSLATRSSSGALSISGIVQTPLGVVFTDCVHHKIKLLRSKTAAGDSDDPEADPYSSMFEGSFYQAGAASGRAREQRADGHILITLSGSTAGHADGLLTKALFNKPRGIAAACNGRILIIADAGNHCIRCLDIQNRFVTTLCGYPGKAGTMGRRVGRAKQAHTNPLDPFSREYYPLEKANFKHPSALCVSLTKSGVVYVCDTGNHCVKMVDTINQTVRVVAGLEAEPGLAEGFESLLDSPVSICEIQDHTLLVVDRTGIHRVCPERCFTWTVVSIRKKQGWRDGPLFRSLFFSPNYAYFDGERVFVSDVGNQNIRMISFNAEPLALDPDPQPSVQASARYESSIRSDQRLAAAMSSLAPRILESQLSKKAQGFNDDNGVCTVYSNGGLDIDTQDALEIAGDEQYRREAPLNAGTHFDETSGFSHRRERVLYVPPDERSVDVRLTGSNSQRTVVPKRSAGQDPLVTQAVLNNSSRVPADGGDAEPAAGYADPEVTTRFTRRTPDSQEAGWGDGRTQNAGIKLRIKSVTDANGGYADEQKFVSAGKAGEQEFFGEKRAAPSSHSAYTPPDAEDDRAVVSNFNVAKSENQRPPGSRKRGVTLESYAAPEPQARVVKELASLAEGVLDTGALETAKRVLSRSGTKQARKVKGRPGKQEPSYPRVTLARAQPSAAARGRGSDVTYGDAVVSEALCRSPPHYWNKGGGIGSADSQEASPQPNVAIAVATSRPRQVLPSSVVAHPYADAEGNMRTGSDRGYNQYVYAEHTSNEGRGARGPQEIVARAPEWQASSKRGDAPVSTLVGGRPASVRDGARISDSAVLDRKNASMYMSLTDEVFDSVRTDIDTRDRLTVDDVDARIREARRAKHRIESQPERRPAEQLAVQPLPAEEEVARGKGEGDITRGSVSYPVRSKDRYGLALNASQSRSRGYIRGVVENKARAVYEQSIAQLLRLQDGDTCARLLHLSDGDAATPSGYFSALASLCVRTGRFLVTIKAFDGDSLCKVGVDQEGGQVMSVADDLTEQSTLVINVFGSCKSAQIKSVSLSGVTSNFNSGAESKRASETALAGSVSQIDQLSSKLLWRSELPLGLVVESSEVITEYALEGEDSDYANNGLNLRCTIDIEYFDIGSEASGQTIGGGSAQVSPRHATGYLVLSGETLPGLRAADDRFRLLERFLRNQYIALAALEDS